MATSAMKRAAMKQPDARRKSGKAPARTVAGAKQMALPEVVDMRRMGLSDKCIRRYETAMRCCIRRHAFPGCASMCLVDGKLVQDGGFGFADTERGIPFDKDSICRIVCLTKTIIALCFGRLVEEGLVGFEDKLEDWIPAFKGPTVQHDDSSTPVPAKRPIRMKHLLVHSAGLGYSDDERRGEDKVQLGWDSVTEKILSGETRTLQASVELMARQPLRFHPGENYEYSFAFDVLGRIIEMATGRGLREVLRERVMGPLGMTSTGWDVPKRDISRLAACYSHRGTFKKCVLPLLPRAEQKRKPSILGRRLYRIDSFDHKKPELSNYIVGRASKLLSGGGFITYLEGGMVSTVADTFRMTRMMVKHGKLEDGSTFLKASTLRAMERNRVDPAWGSGEVCFLGNIGAFTKGRKDFGMGGAACTYFNVDRKAGTAIVWFTQNVDMADMKGEEDVFTTLPREADRARARSAGTKRPAASKPPTKKLRAA